MNTFIKEKMDKLVDIMRNVPITLSNQEKIDISTTKCYTDMIDFMEQTFIECDKCDNLDDFATLFAIYCNYFALLNLHKYKNYNPEDTLFGINKKIFDDKSEYKDYLSEIFYGIWTQKYFHFENATKINYNYQIAHVYLFVKDVVNYFYYEYENDNDNKEYTNNSMIEHFQQLSEETRLYVLSIKDTNVSLLPCIKFRSNIEEKFHKIENNYRRLIKVCKIFGINDNENIIFPLMYHLSNNGDKISKQYNCIIEKCFTLKKRYENENISEVQKFIIENIKKYDGNSLNGFEELEAGILLSSIFKTISDNNITPKLFKEGKKFESIESIDYSYEEEFLHLSNQVYFPEKLRKSFMHTKMSVAQANREKQKAIEYKNTVINEFSHTYKNMRATSLYNVASALIKKEDKELKNYGRQVLLEYGIKKNLTKEVEMLTLKFEERDKELYDKIHSSICFDEETGDSIYDILDNSMKRCFITLVHDGNENAKFIRKSFKEFDLVSLRNEFEENILFSEKSDVSTFKWFSENVFPITCNVSETWNNIRMKTESYASLMLTSLISEFIINIFKYADKTKDINLNFSDSKNKLTIEIKNSIAPEFSNERKSGVGLSSNNDTLQILNKIGSINEKAITSYKDGDFFITKVILNKFLFKED